ncbi:MAG TPA: 6-phosphogluconolactonase [Acidimicrobiia bacterium]|jgi:6-phosphogluconolactonase
MPLQGEVRVVDDVARAFAALVADLSPRSLALSGGDTARRCYELLPGVAVDWSGCTVWFGDERWVAVDDPDSNEGMAREAFLDRVTTAAVHSMRGTGDSIDVAAASYDALVGAADPIALVHLGLGPDGHTASLFPGSPALSVRDRLVVPNPGDAAHPHDRLTFTFPAIARSDVVVFTVDGDDKRDAVARARDAGDVPAAQVTAGRVVWLLDHAAAGDQ